MLNVVFQKLRMNNAILLYFKRWAAFCTVNAWDWHRNKWRFMRLDIEFNEGLVAFCVSATVPCYSLGHQRHIKTT